MAVLASFGVLVDIRYKYIRHLQNIWIEHYCSLDTTTDEERESAVELVNKGIDGIPDSYENEEDTTMRVGIPGHTYVVFGDLDVEFRRIDLLPAIDIHRLYNIYDHLTEQHQESSEGEEDYKLLRRVMESSFFKCYMEIRPNTETRQSCVKGIKWKLLERIVLMRAIYFIHEWVQELLEIMMETRNIHAGFEVDLKLMRDEIKAMDQSISTACASASQQSTTSLIAWKQSRNSKSGSSVSITRTTTRRSSLSGSVTTKESSQVPDAGHLLPTWLSEENHPQLQQFERSPSRPRHRQR
jgi:hypothetical protein